MQIREVNSGHARSLIAFVGSHVSRCRHFASVRGFTAEEREQRRVDLIRVSPTDVVWAVGDLDHGQIGDQPLVAQSRRGDLERDNAVGGRVHGQDRDVDLGPPTEPYVPR